MTTTMLNIITPLDAPLPPPPAGDVFTESQWTTLMAIADTVIPTINVSSEPSLRSLSLPASEYSAVLEEIKDQLSANQSSDLPAQLLRENATSLPAFKDLLRRTMGEYVHEDARKGLRVILSALNTRAGCLLMTGSITPFHLQPINIRHQTLQSWSQSYLPPLRQSATAFSSIVAALWVKTSPTLGPTLGFPRAPVHGKPGKGFDYSFIQVPPGDKPEVLETDVVIVGSGCGGAVSAKNCAEAGLRVIVVEKAYHWGPEHLPMTEKNAGIHLFANGGAISSDDASMIVSAGQVFGGGGTVNWSASLQTQAIVRKEWADGGLPFFTSSEYQTCLDRVCRRMGVSTNHIENSKNNAFLAEGARRLGYSYKPVPQNTAGSKHHCGYCTLGCGAAEKQGPVVSFLPDAEKAGCKFIEGFSASKILFETVKGKTTAVGVEGTWTSRDQTHGVSGPDRTTRTVIIKAKRVIVSGGTLSSPLLLLRSGLKNPHIGRNLHLHPVTLVSATYPNKHHPINPWEGPILTVMVDELHNLDGHGHGVSLEAMTMLPAWALPVQPWRSAIHFKTLCAKFRHMTSHITLVRDRDPGRVYPDPVTGACRIAYTPSVFDRKMALEGVIAAVKIAFVQGAQEIHLAHTAIPPFTRQPPSSSSSSSSSPEENDNLKDPNDPNSPSLTAYLTQIRSRGLPIGETGFGSAHQMGTCRMAASPREGVVDPKGKVWGVEGLYVADASLFPSASGVNPMVTTMAICDFVSRGVVKGLVGEGEMRKGRL